MNILLIEDDRHISSLIANALKDDYTVTSVYQGQDGIDMTRHNRYAAIILDLDLPDMSGVRVCEKVRSSDLATPIIVITGDDDSEGVVTLLDCGADDYLRKPFKISELKARLRAVSRRRLAQPYEKCLQVGDIKLNLENQLVQRAGLSITLRRKELNLLKCLMLRPGLPVSRATLLSAAWDEEDDTWETTVDVHIKYLRDKLDKPFREPVISTVRGIGYKLEADFASTPVTVKRKEVDV